MSALALKLLLAPTLVVLVTLAGRRWGPAVSGVLVTLPVVAGPILLITAIEHGSAFGARAAEASLLGLVALAGYAVVFAWCSLRTRWLPTLLVAWAACLAVGAALATVRTGAVVGLLLAVGAALAGGRALPSPDRTREDGGVVRVAPPWWDLPARAAATGALVLAVTGAAATLGPARTGVLAPFPIAISVVSAFALAHDGPAASTATLRGVLRGLGGFAVFCFLVAVLLPRVPLPVAFLGALLVATAVQVAVVLRPSLTRVPA